MPQTYTSKEKYTFIIAMFGQNMLYGIISTGLTYYFQSVIFIPAIAVSIIFTAARVWDALKDPIMGSIVDSTHTKFGKCRPYLFYAPSAVFIATILCFVNGIYSSENAVSANIVIIAWAAISYLLWGFAYTAGDVPLWGIIPLMSEDEKDRSGLLSLAKIAGALGGGGVMIAIVPVSQMVSRFFNNQYGNTRGLQYGVAAVAITLTLLSSLMFQLAGVFTRERVRTADTKKRSILDNFKLMLRCKPFRQLLISGIVRSPVNVITVVQTTLFAYYFGDNGRTSYILMMLLIGGANFAGQTFSMLLVPKFTDRFSKEGIYRFSTAFSAVPYILIFVLYLIAPNTLNSAFGIVGLTVLMVCAGLGMGAVNVLTSIMIADAIDYEEYHTYYRPDAVFFSGQSFMVKLSSGVAAIISGIGYAIVGFSGDGVRAVNDALYNGASFKADAQFEKIRMMMFFLCSIPPAIGIILSLIPMRKYALPTKEHRRILAELQSRRQIRNQVTGDSE